MPDRARLLADEAAGAVVFEAILTRIPEERRVEPTVTPEGWSPQTVVVHVAAWLDECAGVLEAMVAGTWDPAAEPEETPERVAAINRAQAGRAAALTWSEAAAAVAAARVRARSAWEALPDLTPDAWSWFEESGPNHYAKHVHDLTAWLSGEQGDPDVGRLLQDDAEGWVAFARLVESVLDPGRRDEDGWSIADVCHHVAVWMDLATVWATEGIPWSDDTDGINATALAGSRQMSFGEARLELDEARSRLRAALSGLAEPSTDAKEAFHASTVEHYDEHVPMLGRLIGSGDDVP